MPNGGEKSLIKNWRPIALLNVSYKILAMILAGRLGNVLRKVVNSTQTSFVKGRYILENLLTGWEAKNWAKESKQYACVFLIDFEKAYDRIECTFIFMMFQDLGFPKLFCLMVRTLMQDAKAFAEVNWIRSENFDLTRSTGHGCQLTCYFCHSCRRNVLPFERQAPISKGQRYFSS